MIHLQITWNTPLAQCIVDVDGASRQFIGHVRSDGKTMFQITGKTVPDLRRNFQLSCHLICANA